MILTEKKDIIKPCELVSSIEEGLAISDLLLNELKISHIPGVGLAASQIGIYKKVFITALPNNDEINPVFIHRTYINPEIISLEEPIIFENEGCLSFPGEKLETLRYNRCVFSHMLEDNPIAIIGLPAVVFQHEYDHLHGKTMYDAKFSNIEPNSACPCNSGKKYKKCCRFLAKRIK